MAIQQLTIKYTGIDQLLQNNPQTVDPFNKFSKEKKLITDKKKKTDDDLIALRKIDIRSKIFFDDKIGIYIPASWVLASIQGVSWAKAKIKKDNIRASVFATEQKIKLTYQGMDKVKTALDIVGNEQFHHIAILPQGQVRVTKATPIFSDWGFTATLDFDNTIINAQELKGLIEYGAAFGGFGDFRPTFGRATVEFIG
jgi:hypothetical protein